MATHAFDSGGSPDGDGTLGVSIDRFYGEDLVCIDFEHGVTFAYLTAAQAREVAEDLMAHAAELERAITS